MALTHVERERIVDSRLKLQTVTNSLKHINPENVPQLEEIEECLEKSNRNLGLALRSATRPDETAK